MKRRTFLRALAAAVTVAPTVDGRSAAKDRLAQPAVFGSTQFGPSSESVNHPLFRGGRGYYASQRSLDEVQREVNLRRSAMIERMRPRGKPRS